jgi:Mn-dependent DtxR family transcriptional regulator
MYLETIYMLSKRNNAIRSIDVCEEMGYSKPSVSRAVKILKQGEYITVDQDGIIRLTDKGLKVAESMYERHTLLTNFLINLGVDPKIAANDACKIEHVISEESFDAMRRHAEGKDI